jgi:hypothetical protein
MMCRIVVFVLSVIAFQPLWAQSDVENKLKLAMWTNPPAEFKVTEVPEKWKNESAVVLALEREYIGDFSVKMTNRYYVEKLNIHFRIKLLDKAAVTDFSDLSFDDKSIRTNMFGRASKYRIIGIKVFKSDGSGKEVDLSTAVKTDITEEKELKIPIPNLEPGDIIDYYIAIKDEQLQRPNFGDEIMLEGKYPILMNILRFSIPEEFKFFSYPKNGAPAFKKTVVKNDHIYEVKIPLQEKAPDLLWDYEYRTAAHIRYKISSGISKVDNPKSQASELLESFGSIPLDIGMLEDYVKLSLNKEKDPKKLTREIYYLLRNPIYKKAFFDIEQGNPLYTNYMPNKFFYIMDRFLTEHKISHEVLLVSPRSYGPIPDVVSFSNCDLMIKVNTTPPIYIARPGPFTLVNEVPYILEGTDAASGSSASYRPLPETKADKNVESKNFTVALMPDDVTKLQVKRTVLAKGHTRRPNQYAVFTNYDYMVAYDKPQYQVQSSRVMGGIIKEYNKEKAKFEQRMVQDYHERDERMKKEVEAETSATVTNYTLAVKTIGMWDETSDTEFEDNFVLEGLIKKAGPNSVVELGKLIGGQTEVKEEYRTRTRDVYMDYVRTLTSTITFTIPDGFELEGLENLRKQVETDAGGFVSTATVTGNTLQIVTKKYYSKNYYTASEWPKLTGFLDAAVEFENSKVLLRKK